MEFKDVFKKQHTLWATKTLALFTSMTYQYDKIKKFLGKCNCCWFVLRSN